MTPLICKTRQYTSVIMIEYQNKRMRKYLLIQLRRLQNAGGVPYLNIFGSYVEKINDELYILLLLFPLAK